MKEKNTVYMLPYEFVLEKESYCKYVKSHIV